MPRTQPPTEFEVLGFRRRGFSATGTPSTANVSFGGLAAVISGDSPVQGQIYAGFTPTIYAAPASVGTGDGSSEGNARSLALVLTEVSQGAIVGCIPGVYSIARGARSNTPAWHPTNSGTLASPIKIVAKYAATSLSSVATNADRTEFLHTGASAYNGTNSGPLYGSNGRNYIHWIGIYCDETDFYTKSDNGPVYLAGCTGCVIEDAVIDMNPSALWVPSDNHNCIRIGEGTANTIDAVIRNCRMTSAYTNSNDDSNAAAIMLYGAENFVIENCEIANCNSVIYVKGGGLGGTVNSGEIRYNYLHDGDYIRVQFTDPTGLVKVHHNVFESMLNSAVLLNQSCDNFEFYSNTVVMDVAITNGGFFVNTGAAAETGLVCRDNIFYGTGANRYGVRAGALTASWGTLSGNLYYNTAADYDWSYNGTDYTTLGGWQAIEATASSSNPNFLGTGTGAEPYKRSAYDGKGAYETGSETIGVAA